MTIYICDAVSEQRLGDADLFKRYGVFLHLTKRLLGCKPAYTSYAHSSTLTLNFYFGALRSCLRIPACDFGFADISPSQRRLALFQSCLTHRCPYCLGHVCIMGDMIKGSQFDQIVQAGGWDQYCQQRSEHDELIKRLVREVCSFPARLTAETKNQFIAAFGTAGFDEVTSMVSYMGWLNYGMGSMGMQLESKAAPVAGLLFDTFDPDSNISTSTADDGDTRKGEQALQNVKSTKHAVPWRRFFAHLRNLWTFISLIPTVVRGMLRERAMFQGIPTKATVLDAFMVEHFGCLPGYIRYVEDELLKRVLVFGSREVFLKDEQTKWTRSERVSMLYIFGRKVENSKVVDDALLMARMLKQDVAKSGNFKGEYDDLNTLPVEKRKGQLELLYAVAESDNDVEDRLSAAMRFVHQCAGPVNQVSEKARRQVVEKVLDHRSLVDLTGIISFCAFIHRVTVFRACALAD